MHTLDPPILVPASLILGLAVGSFLNVVVYRLPLMMEREWRRAAEEIVAEEGGAPAATPEEPFNLMVPHSHCPCCGKRLRPWHNVPLVSYVVQRGRCASCRAAISPRYPLVELLCGLAFALLAARLGGHWALPAAMAATAALLTLAMIDLGHRLLPDDIVQPLLWLGLLANLNGAFAPLDQAVIGAAAGYGSLWVVSRAYRLVRGGAGMGDGDLKLLAALGAWLGWKALVPLVLLATLAALAVSVVVVLGRRNTQRHLVPYGTYLALAGWALLAWGERDPLPHLMRLAAG